MQGYYDSDVVSSLSTEYFASILALFLVIAIIVIIVKVTIGGSMMERSMGITSSKKDSKKEPDNKLCKNCHYEPVYGKGLCRYCIKYI